mmetsp:Transcript_39147/g.96969  ORF Transcript_39147/g.96969 Transcript_39147/m.96969 type:complete len:332 (-) Transcript_39147:125-1120(-)
MMASHNNNMAAVLLGLFVLATVALWPAAAQASANQSAAVQHDCTCKCCKADDCPNMKTYTLAVGSADQCDDSMCRSKFYDCPDYGSHNADAGIVMASYHDCTCSCCRQGECSAGLKEFTFYAESPSTCTPAQCSSSFYGCPDPGAHNADNAGTDNDALVFATYHDCMCACCKEGECPELKYNMFYSGGPAQCNERACSSKFFSCPDTGSHNAKGSVVALFSGQVPSPPPPGIAPVINVLSVGKNETLMPTYGVALLVVFFVGSFLSLIGVCVYRRVQRERGYKWVLFDDAGRGGAGSGPGGMVELIRVAGANGNGAGGSNGAAAAGDAYKV